MSEKKVNRFKSAHVIRVNSLPTTFVAAAIVNGFVAAVFLLTFWFVWGYYSDLKGDEAVASEVIKISTVPPLSTSAISSSVVVEFTPYPTYTPLPTFTPLPTWTPLPTLTPLPTWTPLPTSTPTLTPTATSTPFPTSTPYKYSLDQLQEMSKTVKSTLRLQSQYAFALYRSVCVSASGLGYISPFVVGSFDFSDPGYQWKLDNFSSGFDYSELRPVSESPIFYLSDNQSLWSIQMFWHDDPISERVTIDYPSQCKQIEFVYVPASETSNQAELNVTIQ